MSRLCYIQMWTTRASASPSVPSTRAGGHEPEAGGHIRSTAPSHTSPEGKGPEPWQTDSLSLTQLWGDHVLVLQSSQFLILISNQDLDMNPLMEMSCLVLSFFKLRSQRVVSLLIKSATIMTWLLFKPREMPL